MPTTSPRSSGRSSTPACPCRSWSRPRGRRHRPSAAATSAAARTAAASASSRSAAGRSTTRTSSRRCCAPSRSVQEAFNSAQSGGKPVSLADVIVLGGCAGVEQAAKNAGHDVSVAVHAGTHRRDPGADRRRVVRRARADRGRIPQLPRQGTPAACRVPAHRSREPAEPQRARADRARRRAAGPRGEPPQSPLGVFTAKPQTLTNDFFVNLLDMDTTWTPTAGRGRRDLRGSRRVRRGQVDGQPGRPRVRLELRAARRRRGLRERRRAGEVRARLRRRVGQGHEPRPVRRALIPQRPDHRPGRPNTGRPGRI